MSRWKGFDFGVFTPRNAGGWLLLPFVVLFVAVASVVGWIRKLLGGDLDGTD